MRSYRKILQLLLGAALLLSPSMTRAQSGTSSAAVSQFSLKNVLSCVDTSASANTITCASTQPIGAYSTSQFFLVTVKNANTGATTININGLGAVAVNKNATQALVSGDVAANGTYWMYYTGSVFDIVGITGGTSSGSMTWPAAAGIAVYAGANAWGTSLTAPTGAIVGTTDTQTLTNKTLDGVTPATMAFVDPTSSIQTQLNTKAPSASPTLTGTDTGTETLTNKTVDGVTPTTFGFVDPTSSIQTQLNAKAPLASPTFTGTVTTAASAAGGAGLNLPPGVAPTTPNNGDLWTTTAGLFAQINGATVGPFGTGAGSITLQTNGAANGSNSALNFVTSATNSTGLSATPSNINTNQEKIEVGGTLNLASLVAPAAAGDVVCGNSTPNWSDCVPGIAGRTVTTATDTIGAGDRLNSVLYNSASAVAVTLTSAASLGNNFSFKACNENTGTATFTPGAGQINGSGSLPLAEGQCASVNSPDNVNYIASISNGAISTDTSLSITRSPFGVQLGLSVTSFPFSGGPAGTSFQDVAETANPGNPAAGIDRVYFDSTTHLLTCHTNSGGNCAPSGSSTPTFDSGGTGLGQPAANAAWTMGANTIAYTFGATTGTNSLMTVTDTLNNTGTGYLLKVGTATGSAANGLDLFATGSAAGAFTNAFTLNVSNPTAATSSQAQPSPKSEMCGRTWSGAGADTAECWSWQVVPAANTTNPGVNLTLVHESGTTGPLGLSLPASLTLTANTFTANSTTGGLIWNGPSSSLFSLGSGGNANITSATSGSVNINGGQILISPSGTSSIKLLGSSTASDVVTIIHFGNASPTGDALDFQNSSNVVQASFGPNFTFTKYNSTALVGSGMDYDVFNTVHGNTNASITSTTLATVGATDQNFTVTGGISQTDVGTTCSVAGSVQVNIIYTDALSGIAVTVSPDIDAGTVLPAVTLPFSTSAVGAANVGTFRWMGRAKASTTISYSTTYNNGTCGTQANMNIAPVLELR